MNAKHSKKLLAVMMLAGVISSCRTVEAGEITAKAVRVSETRVINLNGDPKLAATLNSGSNYMIVRIRLTGSDLADATHRGILKETVITEDAGNSLIIKTATGKASAANLMYRIKRDSWLDVEVYETEVRLRKTARAAKAIAEFRGEIKLRIATRVRELTVPVADLHKNGKIVKMYQNAALKKLNIAITRGTFANYVKSGSMLRVHFKGQDHASVFAVTVVGKGGKFIGRMDVSGSTRQTNASLFASRKLRGGEPLSLKIRVATESKTVVVPIRLKNIPLP